MPRSARRGRCDRRASLSLLRSAGKQRGFDRNYNKEYRADVTYWIDKQTLVFRKIRRISDGSMMVSKNLHLPSHFETTETYPVAEIDPATTAEMFRFTPPADAKEVATLEDFGGPPHPLHPKAQMLGQVVPDVTFTGLTAKRSS